MHPVRRALFGLALVTVAASCSSSSEDQSPTSDPTGPALARGGQSEVPRDLRGSCDTEVIVLSASPDGRLELRDEYTCRLSHLGLTRSTVLQSVIPAGPPDGALLPVIVTNTAVYVAANGDHLTVTFSGTGVTNLVSFTSDFQGTLTFSGGTGRFTNASGTAEVVGTAALDPATGTGTAHFTLVGSLTY
jgi:hypothetical protein